jgi:hypothetical protein
MTITGSAYQPTSDIRQSTSATTIPYQQSSQNRVDQIWQQYPQYRNKLESMGISGKQQVFNNDQTGEAVIATTLPSGQVQFNTQQVGTTAGQRAFEKTMGEANGAAYKDGVEKLNTLSESGARIDQLIDMTQDPKFKNIVGQYGQSTYTSYFGSPEEKQLLGDFVVSSNKFGLDLLNSMKGSSSDKDLKFIESSVPNKSDSFNAIIGKNNGLKVIQQLDQSRQQAYLTNIQNGMNAADARMAANKQFNLQDVKPQIKAVMDGKLSPDKVNPSKTLVKASNGKLYLVPKDEISKFTSKEAGGTLYG